MCKYELPSGSTQPGPDVRVYVWHQSILSAVDDDDVFWQGGTGNQTNVYTDSTGGTFTVIPTTVDGAQAHVQAGDDGCDIAVQGVDGSVLMVEYQLMNTPQSFGKSTSANLSDPECNGARAMIADFSQASS